MAGVDASRVLVGAPDQSGASGAINRAPLGTVVPTDARTVLNAAFKSGGYVSPDGVKLTPELSTTDLKDWLGATIRKVLEGFTGTVAFSFIQFSEEEAKMVFGDDAVTVKAATPTSGKQIQIALGPVLPEPGAWVFKMKDGQNLIRIVLPNAQPVSWPEMPFVANQAIPLGTSLACYPDADGKSIYIHTDDGVFSK